MLTDVAITNLKPTGSQYVVWDFPCFGIRVSARAKTFVLKQHNRYHTIGRWPIISLKEARDEAKRRLALKYFPDPAIPTKEAIARFLEARRGTLRPSSLFRYRTNLDHYSALIGADGLLMQFPLSGTPGGAGE